MTILSLCMVPEVEDQVRQPLPLDLLEDRSTVEPVLEAKYLLLQVLL